MAKSTVTSESSHSEVHPENRLRKGALGTWDLVFFVLAAAAPLTVVAGVIPLAIMTGELSATYGYIVPGIVLVLFAMGFTAMSRFVKNAGAFYAYIARGLGKALGVGSSLIAVLAYNSMTICLVAGFSFYAHNSVVHFTGADIPWPWFALFAVVGIAVLGYFRITLSARILGIALGLEVLILVIYEVVVLANGGGPQGVGVEAFNPLEVINPGFGAMLVLTAGGFIGFEATAIYAEETRDPRKSVPRATYIAIAFLAIFYTFSAWVVITSYGPTGAVAAAQGDDVANLVFNSAGSYLGMWAVDIMQVLLVTSSFAAALAFHNAASRYHYALGRERVLPSWLGRVSVRHGSPIAGVLAQTAVTAVVLAIAVILNADPYLVVFLWSAAPGVLGVLVLEMITAVAVVAYFWKARQGFSLFRVTIAPAVAALGLAALVTMAVLEIELLTAAAPLVNALLLIPIPALLIVGVVYARYVRKVDPARYDRFTEIDPEADPVS